MFIKLGPKAAEVPIAVLVPNFITTLSLCSGLASLHFSLGKKWELALFSIFLAMIFDTLDGRAARLLHVSSKFGAVLDSLSDFVSFGIAPAVILHEWLLAPATTPFELSGVMIFALCSGMRLARFTAAVPSTKPATSSNYFTGMPTPAAAGAVLIPAMVKQSGVVTWEFPQWSVATFALLLGLLMVSRVPTYAFKKLKVQRRLIVPIMLLIGLGMVSLVTSFWFTLSIVATLNFALTPVSWYMKSRAKSSEESPRAIIDAH